MKTNVYILKYLIIFFSAWIFAQAHPSGNNPGEPIPGEPDPQFPSDTIFIFNSPRPLIDTEKQTELFNYIGMKFLLSNSGFGFGGIYGRKLTNSLTLDFTLFFSGKKGNEDSFVRDPFTNQILVRNKINRVYMMPIMLGVRTYLFQDKILNSFKPFIGVGGGLNIVMVAPYLKNIVEFENGEVYGDYIGPFNSLSSAEFIYKPGAYFDGGVEFIPGFNVVGSINFRYYYIPTEDGIESSYKNTIKNFGGFFISINIGKKF